MNQSENKAGLKCWDEALVLSPDAVPRMLLPASERWLRLAKVTALLTDTGISTPQTVSALRYFAPFSYLCSPELVNTP